MKDGGDLRDMAKTTPGEKRKHGGAAGGVGAERRSFVRFRLTLVVLAALILGAVGYGAWSEILDDRETANVDARRRAHALADAAAAHATMTFRLADTATRTLAHIVGDSLRQGGFDAAKVSQYARAAVDDNAPYRNLMVTDDKGVVIVENADIPADFNVSDREFFAVHRNDPNAGMFISDLLKSRLGHGWFIAVSRRINLPDGGFAGVAYVVIDLTYFEREYSKIDVGDYGFVTLWARGGRVLARMPRDQTLVEDPGAYADRVSRLRAPDLVAESFARSPIDRLDRWIITRDVDGAPLRVSVGLAEKEILAGWERAFPYKAAVAALAAALVIALTVILLIYLSRLEATAAALRESDRRSRALFESTFEYISMLTPDGRILAVNQAVLDSADSIEKSDGKALIGIALWQISPWRGAPTAQRQLRDGVRGAACGDFVRFESEVHSSAGMRVVDVSVKPIFDDRGLVEMLIAEARDVTERKRGEDSLRAGEARVRSYFEAAMESIVVADRSGRFVDVNPAACRLFGYQREAMTELSIADMLPAACNPDVTAAAHLAQVNASGNYRGMLDVRRSDGAVRRTEVSAVRLDGDGYLGVFHDVTAQLREADALKAGNIRINALLRAIPDLVMLMDGDGLYLEIISPPSDSLLVIAAGRLLGRRPGDVLPAEAARRMMSSVAAVIASQQVATVEFQLDLADGVHWFEARFSAIIDERADEALVLQITRDVTEQVQAAARLADAKEQAEAANRTKSVFLATMSHELRTPLNAVIGFSEIMRSEMFGPIGNARYRGYVDNIFESGGHLLSLINDVLDISKLEAGKYALEESRINIAEIIENCCVLNDAAAAGGELRLTRRLDPGLPVMYGDERAVRQILLNLLSNAVKFTPAGGRIDLTARRADDGGLIISIADTGIGIPGDSLKRIAQPFQQVDNSIARRFGGTGLGLAISRNLAELHGGRLQVNSVEGRGTEVSVFFPAERLQNAEEAAA